MEILLDEIILNYLAKYLSVSDLNNFRIANYLETLKCQITVKDKSSQVYTLLEINDSSAYLYDQIQEKVQLKLSMVL